MVLSFGANIARGQEPYQKVEVKVSTDKVKVGGKLYYSHVVAEKQTLYSISKVYGIAVIDIIEANPKLHLSSSPLRAGDLLLIPVDKANIQSAGQAELPAPEVTAAEDTSKIDETPVSEALVLFGRPFGKPHRPQTALLDNPLMDAGNVDFTDKHVSVTLLLPFDADTTANKNYLNFYFGALLSVKELAEKGAIIEVNAIDVSQENALQQNKRVIGESDIIIGPISSYDIARTLSVIPDNKYIISPLDPRTESLTKTDHVILAATPAKIQIEDMASWIAEDMQTGTDSLIVVTETAYKQSSTQTLMESSLEGIYPDRKIEVNYSLSSGLEMNEWFDVHTHLKDSVTRVVAASEHDIFIKDVIRNVYLQKNMKKNVVMYGPAKTKSVEMEEMCDAFLHNSVTYHIDYSSAAVIRFIKDYRALYGGEPDSYAFHGYDTVKYFISAYAEYGEKWSEHLEKITMSGLQTYFHFRKPDGSEGAFNTGIRRVVYSPGYKVEVSDR